MRIFALLMLAVSLLSGCQLGIAPPGAVDRVSFGVGENEIGEPCKVVSALPGAGVPKAYAVYDVFCGRWEEPSGHIFRGPHAGRIDTASYGWWQERLDRTLTCAPPVATSILDDVAAAARDCAFRIGNWPYQALAAQIGAEIYLADGIPAAYPAMERALGLLAGRLERSAASKGARVSQEIERLEARLAGARYSVGDLQEYRDLLRLAQYLNFQGDFPDAEQRYRKALALQEKVVAGDLGSRCFLYMHIALELSNQEQFELAGDLFEKAERVLCQLAPPTDEARLVSYRAMHLANQREDAEAYRLAQRATGMRRDVARQYGAEASSTVGSPDRTPSRSAGLIPASGAATLSSDDQLLIGLAATALGDLVQSQYLEGAMLVELGRFEEAQAVLGQALRILDREPRVPRRWIPQIHFVMARIAELRGDLARAEALLLKGIEKQRGLFRESRSEGLAYLALGRVYEQRIKPAKALEAFRVGFEIIANRGRALQLSDAVPFFQTGLAEAVRNPGQRPAIFSEMFEVGQMIRQGVAARTMALTAARLADSEQTVGALIRELQDARWRRDELQEMLTIANADPSILAPQVTDLEERWEVLTRRAEELERNVQAAAPRYNQLLDVPVSTEDVQAALRAGEAVVQVLLGAEITIGFLVDRNGVEVFDVDLSEGEAAELVATLRYPFEVTDRIPEFPVGDAHALYRRLFGPVAARIAAVKHLIVVPSGPLLSLPFGVLVSEPPVEVVNGDYSRIGWMAQRYALTLAPSVQSFVNLRAAPPSHAPSRFIGFGDFVPHGDPEAVMAALELPESCRSEARQLANLVPLPNTADELRQVAASLRVPASALVLGARFSEETVYQTPLAEYSIVYFATHGLLPHKVRCLPEPALVLSGVAEGSERADGLLTASEVIELKLDADLVVLSACDTAGPAGDTRGEALSGLARSFFYAGARSLLVSHWEIPDAPTVKLLKGAFERLASGDLSVAEALRESQTSMIQIRGWSHPLAWGAFTVVGDGGQRLARISHQIRTPSLGP